MLRGAINSLKGSARHKQAVMGIVDTIEADNKEMEQALEEHALEAALGSEPAESPSAPGVPEDGGVGAEASETADTAALVRTLTGGSAKKGLAERASSTARRRWHVAAAAAATAGLRREKTAG